MWIKDKRWLLENLKNDWQGSHLGVHLTLEQVINGAVNRHGIQKSAYLRTLSDLPEVKSLSEQERIKKLDHFESIIRECHGEGLIDIFDGRVGNGEPEACLKVSSKGYKWLDEFWLNLTVKNDWIKAIVIPLLILFFTWVLTKYVLKPAVENQPPVVNLYPTIQTPDVNVNPIINIYPNATATPEQKP